MISIRCGSASCWALPQLSCCGSGWTKPWWRTVVGRWQWLWGAVTISPTDAGLGSGCRDSLAEGLQLLKVCAGSRFCSRCYNNCTNNTGVDEVVHTPAFLMFLRDWLAWDCLSWVLWMVQCICLWLSEILPFLPEIPLLCAEEQWCSGHSCPNLIFSQWCQSRPV